MTRHPRPVSFVLAASSVLAACSTAPPQAGSAWRVEPVLQVSHGGRNDGGQAALALARAYDGEGRSAQALLAYRRAAAEAPHDADVQTALGISLATQGFHTEAEAVLRRALELAPKRAGGLNNLGYALLLAGRPEAAQEHLHAALALEPGNERARSNLAWARGEQAAATTVPVVPRVEPSATQQAGPFVTLPAGAALVVQAPPTPAHPPIPSAAEARAERVSPTYRLQIVNGNGVPGVAGRVRDWLAVQGIAPASLANLAPYRSASTRIEYRPGFFPQANQVAGHMPTPTQLVALPANGRSGADVRVVLGRDVLVAEGCAALKACRDAGPLRVATSTR
jgi:Flp pilus assembly protein TadD